MDSIGNKEKKSTEAQIKASVKYNQSKDNIMIRPDKDEGGAIRNAAKAAGQSVQAYVLQAIRERMERDAAHSFGILGDDQRAE